MKNSLTHTQFIPAIIITGFSSMMSQIILLRELVIVFLGNEITLGIMLGVWLLGTAIGSGLVGRFSKFFDRPVLLFIILQFLLTIILPLTIIFIRVSPSIWGMQQGELISLLPIILIPITVLLPICILTGFLYTLGCKIYHVITKEMSTAIAKVYLFEAIGSGLASFIVSIILIHFLESFQLALVICTANMIAAMSLIYFYKKRPTIQRVTILSLTTILIISILLAFPTINEFSINKFWRNFNLLHAETTIYGNISVVKFDNTISFFENGFLMFTYPDLLYAEESVHFALLEHPDPRNVLLIGGGVGGSLQQILFHPSIEHVDYVELDPKIIELGQKYLPQETSLKDARVQMWHEDGRLFIKETERKYDVIIINFPDPQTTLINRFYTIEFYQLIKEILTNNGLVGFSVTSSENVIGEDLANFLRCLYNTMSQVFADVMLIPGDTNHFIGCVTKDVLTKDPDVLVTRLLQRKLNTIYLREYYIPYRMSQDRMDYLYDRVVNTTSSRINYDFKPIGNFYSIVVWTTYFSQYIKSIFLFLDQTGFKGILIISLLLILPFIVRLLHKNGREKNFRHGIIMSIVIIGFSEISLEVIIVLGFQAIYGYVYFQLALIFSSFMIGLAIGSYSAIKMMQRTKKIFFQFKIVQLLMALYPFILIIALNSSASLSENLLILHFLFLILIVTVGFIGGYQFPLANHLYIKKDSVVEKVAGSIYASDLAGACIGALVTSAILIPTLGLLQTCLGLALLNLIVFLGLLMAKE